jgi:hypothetical protein
MKEELKKWLFNAWRWGGIGEEQLSLEEDREAFEEWWNDREEMIMNDIFPNT